MDRWSCFQSSRPQAKYTFSRDNSYLVRGREGRERKLEREKKGEDAVPAEDGNGGDTDNPGGEEGEGVVAPLPETAEGLPSDNRKKAETVSVIKAHTFIVN